MKGFYFSLDAMLAAMILTTLMTFLINYTPPIQETDTPETLQKLDTAQKQNISSWNNSYKSNKSVLQKIHQQYKQQSFTKSNNTCNKYFQIQQPYALYITTTTNQRVCGQDIITNKTGIRTSQVTLADTNTSGKFKTHKEAALVIKD